MTIAAGFNCMGGIVMCSDSKEIYPDQVKYDTDKIVATSGEFGTFIFTGATDDADVLNSAIQKLREKVTTKEFAFRRSSSNKAVPLLQDAIRDVVKEVRKESITPFPVDQQPWFQLLIGAGRRGGEDVIYKATPRTVILVDEHECVGVGLTQAKALLDRLYDSKLSRSEMEVFAIYVMRLVKKYVPDVDGYTQVVSIDNTGQLRWWSTPEVIEVEQRFAEFDDYIKEILIKICADPLDQLSSFKGAHFPDVGRMLNSYREVIWEVAHKAERNFQEFLTRLTSRTSEPEQ